VQKRTIFICLLLAVSLIPSPAVPAQQTAATNDWSRLQNIPVGEELVLKLRDGQSVKGRLTTVTDSEIGIRRKNRDEAFGRDSVFQVSQVVRKAEKGKYALIGAGIGAGVGAVAGKAKNSPPIDDGEVYLYVLTPLVAGAGAVGGLLFGMSRRKRVIIYQAK